MKFINTKNGVIIPENPVSKYLFSSTQASWLWLVIRLYVGYAWITAGGKKVTSDSWRVKKAGTAVQGFVKGALAKAESGKDVTDGMQVS